MKTIEMKAIEVKYLAPTNFKGARLKAQDIDGNSVTVSYDHALSALENKTEAMKSLVKAMGWKCESYSHGQIKNKTVFTFAPMQHFSTGKQIV